MSTKLERESDSDGKQIKALNVIKVLVWPLLIIFLVLLFYDKIRDVIGTPGTSIEFGVNGVKIISEQIGKAAKSRSTSDAVSAGTGRRAAEGAEQAEQTFSKLLGRTILWVDDHPENNIFLQNAFSEAGVRIFYAYSNAHARELLAQRRFDLAITDVGRDEEGSSSGLELHPLLSNIKIPVIVYSNSWSSLNRGKERQFNVMQITNDPSIVYSVAIVALSRAEGQD